MKYGVVGRNVNLTARIESYTVGGQIFISENTLEECGEHLLRIEDRIEVMPKGVKNPITIYEVGGIRGDFNVFLPEKIETVLQELKQPVSVLFTILEGKHSGADLHGGVMVKLKGKEAEIRGNVAVDKLSNLKISLLDSDGEEAASDLYAKVTKNLQENPPTFRINFTSIPPEAAAFLDAVLGNE